MSRVTELLQDLERIEAEIRSELSAALAPLGLRVRGIQSDGVGYLLQVDPLEVQPPGARERDRVSALAAPVSEAARGERAATASTKAEPRTFPPRMERIGDETLAALVARAPRNPAAEGPPGIRTPPVNPERSVELLAGTLVGDTVLALTHLGEQNDAGRSASELGQQLVLFRSESKRLVGHADDTLFARAVERWAPAGFPLDPPLFNANPPRADHA